MFVRLWAVAFVLAAAFISGAAGASADNGPQAADSSPSSLPATGQTQAHPARRPGQAQEGPVPDDGQLRAGSPLRFRDNGDGTISDLNTGLMWEKKCRGCGGIHDDDLRLRWSGFSRRNTLWDWLDEVNAEGGTGFAGYRDWRIPNVKELVSIVDYGRSDPAIDPAFAGPACEPTCSDLAAPECSCTSPGKYWTSTTFSDFPAHALVVDFAAGFVEDRIKTMRRSVRAVRGGR
jgi:hypothetical protein